MKGKQPKSVITDGDLAMKSAVSTVFPGAHHKLCSWHLLRNATARVGRPSFLRKFRLCLMGDLEVDEFETIWTDSVADHGLEDHPWIVEIYAKKHSWSNAHIQGKFFTSLKTTSRCEALNMQLGKFIHNGYNLREFVEHFQHYLEFMRRRKLVADYKSAYGEPVVKTKLEAIEQFAATVYTREVFELFREVLMLASNIRVVSTKRTSACVLFEVAMYCKQRSWAVSWAEEDDEFSCSCQRMEFFGLLCVHMVVVLVYLNMTAIPKGLILDRWTKRAKQPRAPCDETRVGEIPDAAYMSMHAAMLDDCRELVSLSCQFFEDYVDVKTRLAKERQSLQDKHRQRLGVAEEARRVSVRDPMRARYKGYGRRVVTSRGKFRRVQRCRLCGKGGHNSRKCQQSSMGENIDSFEVGTAYESMEAGEGVRSTTNLSELAVLFLLAVTHRVELDSVWVAAKSRTCWRDIRKGVCIAQCELRIL
ncbi:hypothetical protein Ahy_B01g052421 isoform E [Arachis hypogaea]|nr:hypothetical protein Ahy_B01g052421 isoform E [Arachis hypogaea]